MHTSSNRSMPRKASSFVGKRPGSNGAHSAESALPETIDRLGGGTAATVVIIEHRTFVRGCIQSIISQAAAIEGVGLSSVDEYLAHSETLNSAIILFCAIGMHEREVDAQLSRLQDAGSSVPVVVMSDSQDAELIMTVMAKGADGFMPADISLEVAAHALRLVLAGGQYFPAETLLAARKSKEEPQSSAPGPRGMFTRRQVAVIDALRRGKANKIIAYELSMCESTVKVHVRNIMKKLNAKNRTEVAYLANELMREV
jgi:DNA-binding NarL/FixJ family response regulator